jgi:hypothetical protein
LPGDHPEIAGAESELGACLVSQRRFDEAEPLLVESYRILLAVRGATAKQTRLALEHVVDLYKESGKAEKATQFRALISH